ncbi:hypothetical protein [Bradyrhizobium cenepequi]
MADFFTHFSCLLDVGTPKSAARALDLGFRKTVTWIATNGWLDRTLSAKRSKRGAP